MSLRRRDDSDADNHRRRTHKDGLRNGSDLKPLQADAATLFFIARTIILWIRVDKWITARAKKYWSDYHDWRNGYCDSNRRRPRAHGSLSSSNPTLLAGSGL